ncbi:hypothetical protein [Methylomarinovum tepidoasis]|nr:hypothetical protein [Methylomarinovum sp. IN45]
MFVFGGVWRIAVFLLMGLVLSVGEGGEDPVQDVVVAVHPGVSVTRLARNELRAIFAMRRRAWPDGTPIRVYVLPDDHPLHRTFCKRILHVYPHQLRRIWDRNVYSGTGQAPVEVDDVKTLHARIAANPGAIGYLPPEWIDEQVKSVEVR